jgi:signal transduction histidine kinase
MGPPIAASLRVAGLAEEVFARTAGSIAALPLIADPRGEVLYSANPQEHGQLLTVVLPEAGAIQASGPEPAAIRAGRWMLSRRQIFDGNITVIMRLDTAGEVREINAMAAHALLLAAGLFTLIMAVIVWLVSRFARALREVTAVAEHVAAGDFSRTIEHQRTDELGALIGAFNEMVRRLRESYAGLHRANRDLESKVDELLRTRSALLRSQKLAVIGETVSTISHEIQNKIGGVSIWAQNLSMHAGSDPTTRLYVQEIQKALSAFLEMLVNFKRYYRQPQLVPTSVDILSLLRQLVHRLNAGAATTTIALHEERAPALPLLSGDADRLDEAVGNLLINALQHSPPGGGVDVFLSGDACGVNITVADRGPGIPDSVQERLFQPFVTTRPDGSGLGLAIAHTIITAHEGTLMYAARPGGGSQFDIRLPVTTSTHPSPCP